MRKRVVQDLKRTAGAHIQNRHWTETRGILAQVCEVDKTDIKSWVRLMHLHLYLHLGNTGQARTCGEHVLRIQPRAFKIMLNVGGLCAAKGNFDLAEQYRRQEIRVNPQIPGSHYNLGNALKPQRKFSEAVDAYREALRLDPNYAEAMLNLGMSLKELAHYEDDSTGMGPVQLKVLSDRRENPN